jgi:hypothetical protein
MTQKDVALYHYVKMCSKNLHKNISFKNHLKVHQEKKHWLHCFRNVFEYFFLIKFIPNHFTCFHNIFETLL